MSFAFLPLKVCPRCREPLHNCADGRLNCRDCNPQHNCLTCDAVVVTERSDYSYGCRCYGGQYTVECPVHGRGLDG